MKEIIFLVEDVSEGGFTAKSLGDSIYTDADSVAERHRNVCDAVACHFTDTEKPNIRVVLTISYYFSIAYVDNFWMCRKANLGFYSIFL